MIESCMTEEKTQPAATVPLVPWNGKPRSYILTSGISKCTNCGADMEGKPLGRGVRAYACVPPSKHHPTKTGCGRVSINADSTDHLVATKVLAYLAMPGRMVQMKALIAKAADEVDTITDKIEAVQARMRQIAADHVEGLASIEAHREANRVGIIRMRALRRQAKKIELHLGAVDGFRSAERLADWWENVACNQEKHDLVRLLIDEVRIHPTAVRGSKSFQPERIEIVWQPGIVWDQWANVTL